MSLAWMQTAHRGWQQKNFPDQTPEHAVMGMMEELGELSHAMLKNIQGIRSSMDDVIAIEKIIDAHCDLIIFSLFLANHYQYDLGTELARTWEEVVSKRDWVADPARGGES